MAAALAQAPSALGQVQITAEVNKTDVALDDQIVLAVTVSGPQASLPEPRLPPLSNFSVYSSGRNQSLSFVNGRVSSSIVHTYVLVPRFVGKGEIPPISIELQGNRAQTEPLLIQVRAPQSAGASPRGPPSPAPSGTASARTGMPSPAPPGKAAGGAAPDVFVTAEIEKTKAYVNEQVTLSIKFYTSVNLLGNPQYTAPKLSGFLAEDLPPERHGNAVVRAKTYYFSEIKTALFPAQAGRLSIGPALVRCQIREDLTIDPFASDFFERFFSQGLMAPQTRELRSDPLWLEALPLPEQGKPKDFSGAVGSFSVSAAADRSRAKVGDAVNLTITIQGTGNLKALGDPSLPPMDSWRVYDAVSSLNLDKKDDRVHGSKVFKTVLVPRVSGDLVIPAVSFSYFDPQVQAYRTAASPPIPVRVDPGEPGAAPAAPLAGPGAAPSLSTVSQDIRYLKAPAPRSLAGRLLDTFASAGPLNGLPFLIFAATLAAAQVRERELSDPKKARSRAALKAALSRIKKAARLGEPPGAAALLSEALAGYLADKLGQSASGLTLRRAQELLRSARPPVSPALIEEARALWEELDLRRFAPAAKAAPHGAEQGRDPAEDLRRLLQALEKELP